MKESIDVFVEELYKPSEGQKPDKSLQDQLAEAISEINENTQTAERQARVLIFMQENGAVEEDAAIKTPDIYRDEGFSDLSQNQVYTAIDNLEEIGAIEVKRLSADVVFIHDRLDELYWDFSDSEVLQQIHDEIQLLVEDCRRNSDVLEKASETLSTKESIEALKKKVFWDDPEEDLFSSIAKYDAVIQSFLSDEDINIEEKDYSQMGWRGVANRLYIPQQLADAMG